MAEFETPQHEYDEPEAGEIQNPEQGEPEQADPLTVRNEDPAAMSEAERNRRLTEQYETPQQ